jgi:hypothetical protein
MVRKVLSKELCPTINESHKWNQTGCYAVLEEIVCAVQNPIIQKKQS